MDIRDIPTSLDIIRMERGKEGEQLIFDSIKHMQNDELRILRNVFVPRNNGEHTELDIIIVTIKGILVIESKNLNGHVYGSAYQDKWTSTIKDEKGNISRLKFLNPNKQNEYHIMCLKQFLNKDIDICSVLVFSDRCELRNIFYKAGTFVTQVANVETVIDNIISVHLKTYYDKEEIEEVYKKLYELTQITEQERQQYRDTLRNKYRK